MPENVADVNIVVKTDAQSVLPRDVNKGYEIAQRGLKPFKVNFDFQGGKGLKDAELALGRISGQANDFSKSIQAAASRTSAFAITAGALIAVERSFSSLLSTSIDVEQQLKKIQIIAGATNEEFNQFSRGIFDVARQTSESFKNASEAALEFARAGNSLEESLKRTRSALALTKIAGVDISTSIKVITTTLNTFNDEVTDSATLVDKLSNVDANFAVSANDLSEALSAVGNTAKESNVKLDDLLGGITAVAARTGQSGNVIGNAFRSIFTRINRPENIELLKDLGVATEDVSGKSRSAIAVLKDLSKVYGGLGDAQRKQIAQSIAGLYQIGRFQAIMRDLGSSFSIAEEASKKAADSFGSANSRIESLNKTTASLLEQSKTNFTQFASSIGKLTFENPLKGFLSSFTADGSVLKGLNDVLAKAADPEKSKGVGETIAKGLLEGIGNFISGPGVVFLAKILQSALGSAFNFLKDTTQNLLGINKAIQEQAVLQGQVNAALAVASAEDVARIKNAKDLNTQVALTVQLLREQAAAATAAGIGAAGAAALSQRGVRAGENAPDLRRFRADGYIPGGEISQFKAHGYIPKAYGYIPKAYGYIPEKNFPSGYTPVREEIQAIKTSPDYSGHRDAKPQIVKDFSIGGKKQDIIINSAEAIVPTQSIHKGYSGPDQYSILNPAQQETLGFNMGYYPKKIPNLAELIKLSSGLIIDSKKQYVFKSTEVQPGTFGNITKKERKLSRSTGFETITQADLAELAKQSIGKIPPLKIIDPSRVLQRDFLSEPKYAKLKNRIFITQSRDLGADKFQETQLGGGFGKSISLDKFSFKDKDSSLKSLKDIESRLGKNYFIKDKYGFGSQGGLYTGEYFKQWLHFIANEGIEKSVQADGGKEALKTIKRFTSNPSRYFAQSKLENSDREFRVTLVGTAGGSVPVSVTPRKILNDKGDSYKFSDPEGKTEKISELLGSNAAKNILSIAQNSFNKIPTSQRIGVVAGADVTHGGVVEFNPSDRIGYSGSLDNPITRGRTAKTLIGVTQQEIEDRTKKGLEILDFEGPENLRKSKFKEFSKSLNILKKDDEIAFFKIASNLVKAGFGIKAGRRKKVLFGDEASSYFSARGFASGFIPDDKHYNKGFLSTFKPTPHNQINESTGQELLAQGYIPIKHYARGYIPNLADPSYGPDVIEKGNIDLHHRPVVKNSDGSISTVRSVSFGTDQGEVLVPTVIDGKIVNDKEAFDHYKKTGEHLGIFKTAEAADKYAEELHKAQEAEYIHKSKAKGYIPNLAFSKGIKDAIDRESQSVDPSKIYISTVSTPKYSGPVVANTRDEPTQASLVEAVNSRLSNGFVPNFAVQSNVANPQQPIDPIIIQRSRLNTDRTISQFTAQLSEEINKIGLSKLLFGRDEDKLLTDIAKKSSNTALSFGAKFNVESFQQARENARPQLQTRRNASASNLGLFGAIGLPIAAGLVDSFFGQTRIGRTTSGALQGAGLGASVGSFLGLPGVAAGTAIGGIAGAGASLLGERSDLIEKENQIRQKEIDKRKQSIEAANTLIGLESQREDLRRQGASPAVLRTQDEKIRETRGNVGSDLLRKFTNINDSVKDFDKRIEAKVKTVGTEAEDVTKQQKLSDAKRVKDDANEPGFVNKAAAALRLNSGTFGRIIEESFLKERSTQFDQKQRGIIGEGIKATAIGEGNKVLIPTEELTKLRNVIQALPGSGFGPSGITNKQQQGVIQQFLTALPKEQREGARQQLQGLKPGDLKGILLPVINNLLESSKQQKQDDAEAATVNKTANQILLDISRGINQRSLQQFGVAQQRESATLGRTTQLNENAPFLTDLAKALEENSIALQKQTDEIEGQKQQNLSELIKAVAQAIPKEELDKLTNEISNLQTSTPETVNDNLKALIDKLPDADDFGKQIESAIKAQKGDFDTQNSKLDASLQEAKRQSGINDQSLRRLDKIAQNTSNFGGLRGLISGQPRIPQGVGREINTTATLRNILRNIPSAGIIGQEERLKQQRTAETGAARGQVAAAEKLKTAGFDQEFINKIVNTKVIEKGNQEDQRKALLDTSFELVRSNPFFSKLQQQKSFEGVERETIKRNDIEFLINQVKDVKVSLPQNQEDQAELVRVLNVLADKFKEIPDISKNQVEKDFPRSSSNFNDTLFSERRQRLIDQVDAAGRGQRLLDQIDAAKTSVAQKLVNPVIPQTNQFNLTSTFNGIQQTNTAINASLTSLNAAIQNLIENIDKLVVSNTADQGNVGESFANINITAVGGGESEKTQQLISSIQDALNNLNYRVGNIQKQTKTVIPPTTNNPFSNINNSSVSLE